VGHEKAITLFYPTQMKQLLLTILKKIGLYHFLQGNYRSLLFALHRSSLRSKYKKYIGKGFTCNCCGQQYEQFAPRYADKSDSAALAKHQVVAGYGENVYCPNCLSTCRERLMIALFTNRIPVAGKHILHLSPEPNIFRFLKQQATVTTADLMPGFYKTIDPAIQFADATRLPFADNAFNMVIANHIMEHIPDDVVAMREIYRVLQPGGIAVLQVPFSETIPHTLEEPGINDPQKQSALFGQKDHVRIYALNDYLNRLQQAGFTVAYQPYESLSDMYQYAIQPQEGFIYITK
jgi:SAM-dependent methyltransferase